MTNVPPGVSVVDTNNPAPTPTPQTVNVQPINNGNVPNTGGGNDNIMADGGNVRTGFFSDFNFVEAGILILATITMLSVIHYTRYMTKNAAKNIAAQELKIQNLETLVDGIKKEKSEQKTNWG